MDTIDIKPPSSRVLAKMKKGEPVRINKGTGFSLAIHPSRKQHIQRKFNQNKGHEVALSPEELDANQFSSKASDTTGSGLYAGKGVAPPRSRTPIGLGLYAGAGLVRNAVDDIEKLGTIIKKHHKAREGSSISGGKIVSNGIPQALVSQPYAENYQWNYTISPVYRR